VAQQAAHSQHTSGIYTSHPSASQTSIWDLLGLESSDFYYKHSPGTSLTPTKPEILPCCHLSPNAAVNRSSCCTELADFLKKKEKLP